MADRQTQVAADPGRSRPPRAATAPAQPGGAHFAAPASAVLGPAILRDARIQGRGNGAVRAAVVQRLQQTVGNRASLRAIQRAGLRPPSRPHPAPPTRQQPVPVQRYVALPSSDYAPTQGAVATHGRMFTAQGTDPHITDAHTIAYTNTNPDRPNLLISQDHSLAIQAAAEPKEFYALPAVVANANRDLIRVQSPVRLDGSSGNSLAVGDKTLNMVRPYKDGDMSNLVANEFANLGFHRCIFIAHRIMGNPEATGMTTDIVFNSPDDLIEGPQKEEVKPDTEVIPEADRLAKFMVNAKGSESRQDLGKALHDKSAMGPVGEEYGRALGSGDLDETAQGLGVNQFARARVGEGYATSSITAGGAKHLQDFSALAEGTGEPTTRGAEGMWGYHFAAVAAESLSGEDHVTLENYNRAPELKRAMTELLARLERDFTAQIARLTIPAKTGLAQRIQLILTAVKEGAGKEKAVAQAEAKAAIDLPAATMWYFKMFGPTPEQSFHAAQAGSGFFVNPLTMRVRPPRRTDPQILFFARASVQPNQGDVTKLKMPGVLSAIRSDLARFADHRVKITAYTDTWGRTKTNKTVSVSRAEAVKKILTDEGIAGIKIITIGAGESSQFPAGGGKSKREANRRAVVEVE